MSRRSQAGIVGRWPETSNLVSPQVQAALHRFHTFGQCFDGDVFVGFLTEDVLTGKRGFNEGFQSVEV